MKIATWSNGKVFSITLEGNNGEVKTLKDTFDKEVIKAIKEKLKPVEKEVELDNKKPTTVRANKINKLIVEIEKSFYTKKEKAANKIAVDKKVVKQKEKDIKKEIVKEVKGLKKAEKEAVSKADIVEKAGMIISGNTVEEKLANLKTYEAKLLDEQRALAGNKSYSNTTHIRRGEY